MKGFTASQTTVWGRLEISSRKLEIPRELPFHAKMCSIKDRKRMDLTKAEDIKTRWQEYTEELYKKYLHDPDNYNGVITLLEPDILECEVKWALGSITTNKARGGDGITVERFQILQDDEKEKAKWLSEEILQTAEKRELKGKRKKERYIHLNAEFQRIARRDKKAFLSDQCKEIEENNRMGKTRGHFKKIRETKGILHAKMGSIKDRNGMDLTEAEDIKKR